MSLKQAGGPFTRREPSHPPAAKQILAEWQKTSPSQTHTTVRFLSAKLYTSKIKVVLSITHGSDNYKKAAEARPDFSLVKKPVFLQGFAGVGLHKDTTAT